MWRVSVVATLTRQTDHAPDCHYKIGSRLLLATRSRQTANINYAHACRQLRSRLPTTKQQQLLSPHRETTTHARNILEDSRRHSQHAQNTASIVCTESRSPRASLPELYRLSKISCTFGHMPPPGAPGSPCGTPATAPAAGALRGAALHTHTHTHTHTAGGGRVSRAAGQHRARLAGRHAQARACARTRQGPPPPPAGPGSA